MAFVVDVCDGSATAYPCSLRSRPLSSRKVTSARLVRRDLAAVYVYGLAADPVGLVGAEEDDGAGHVGSGAWSAHGDVGLIGACGGRG